MSRAASASAVVLCWLLGPSAATRADAPLLVDAARAFEATLLDATAWWQVEVAPPAPAVIAPAPAAWPYALPDAPTVSLGPDPVPAPLQRALTTFALDASHGALTVLELRATYRDGLVAWLNGVEVARRNVAVDAAPEAAAERRHGPEEERFVIPIAPGLLRLGRNVLALEVRAAANRPDVRLAATLVGRRGPRLVVGPMVQRVGADHATVVVETDLPTTATLAHGPTAALGATLASATRARRHVFELAGLPRGAPVHYQVTADDVRSAPATLRLPPAAGEVMRLAIYGDVRGGHATHARLVEAIRADAPDLVLVTGDLVLRGSDLADWQRFFAVTAPLLAETPYYPAIGNHDLGRAGDERRRASDWFALPAPPSDRPDGRGWYAFDVADVHVVMLDSNAYEDPAQLAWLDADLAQARARGVRAILAVTHDGPYSRGSHRGNTRAQRDYVPVLARHRVALLASGHDHIYQRGRAGGLDYVVSGGGGAPLYPITCGVPGRRACAVDDGLRHAAREFHYVMLTIYPQHAELCARRPDRTPLEPCVRLDLRGG